VSSMLYVSLGAVVGANARYFVGLWAAERLGAAFPYGTFLVNVTGSFLVGLFLTLLADRAVDDPVWRLLLVTGFCGGYTTFSTYSFEGVVLMQQGAYGAALLYLFGSVAVGLLAVVAGAGAARLLS
jgi:fluoride exporter